MRKFRCEEERPSRLPRSSHFARCRPAITKEERNVRSRRRKRRVRRKNIVRRVSAITRGASADVIYFGTTRQFRRGEPQESERGNGALVRERGWTALASREKERPRDRTRVKPDACVSGARREETAALRVAGRSESATAY